MNEDSDEDDAEARAGDEVATTKEVEEAVKAAASDEEIRVRLAKGAKELLSRNRRLAATLTFEDLLQGALTAVLDGQRKWPKHRLDFVGLVLGTMRSQAFNLSRILANTTIQTLQESSLARPDDLDAESPIEQVAGETPSPEEAYLRKEEEAAEDANVASLRAQFKPGEMALQVFELMLAGMTKKEIRTTLGMSDKDYWSADRQVGRLVSAFATRRKTE